MRTVAEETGRTPCIYCAWPLLFSADVCPSCGMFQRGPPDHRCPPCWKCIEKTLLTREAI